MDLDSAIQEKEGLISKLQEEVSQMREKKAEIGSSRDAGATEKSQRFHAFDYMQGDVKRWEELRSEVMERPPEFEAAIGGGCGCGSSSSSTSGAFMASEVEKWEEMILKNREEKEEHAEEK